MKKIIICLSTLFVFLFTAEVFAAEEGKEEGRFNPKEAIFSHLGDEYGWSIVLPHGKLLEIPLPVICMGNEGGLFLALLVYGKERHTKGFILLPVESMLVK